MQLINIWWDQTEKGGEYQRDASLASTDRKEMLWSMELGWNGQNPWMTQTQTGCLVCVQPSLMAWWIDFIFCRLSVQLWRVTVWFCVSVRQEQGSTPTPPTRSVIQTQCVPCLLSSQLRVGLSQTQSLEYSNVLTWVWGQVGSPHVQTGFPGAEASWDIFTFVCV